jgi:hypothetical protein
MYKASNDLSREAPRNIYAIIPIIKLKVEEA